MKRVLAIPVLFLAALLFAAGGGADPGQGKSTKTKGKGNRLTFPGRLRGRPLKPGRYVLVAVATDAAGNASSRRRAAFRVVTPRR